MILASSGRCPVKITSAWFPDEARRATNMEAISAKLAYTSDKPAAQIMKPQKRFAVPPLTRT